MTEAMIAEDLNKKKGFNLFKKKEAPKEEIPVPVPPKKEEQMTEQEVQINAIFLQIQRIKESTALLEGELVNLIKNS